VLLLSARFSWLYFSPHAPRPLHLVSPCSYSTPSPDKASERSEEDKLAAAGLARKLLPVLFKLLDAGTATEAQGQVLLETTASLARVAAGTFVSMLFKTLLQVTPCAQDKFQWGAQTNVAALHVQRCKKKKKKQ